MKSKNEEDSGSEEVKEIRQDRIWHHTINEKVDKKSMEKFDVSTNKDTGIDLKAEMEKYLGGDDEVLQGFLDSDDDSMPSFDSLNALKQQPKGIFGRLTGAFQAIVGNKQLTREDMDPILRQFA